METTARQLIPDFPNSVWTFLAAALLGVAILVHAIFPRYEWRAVDANGRAVVVYDRWAGRFQRAVWQDDGTIKGMAMWTPF